MVPVVRLIPTLEIKPQSKLDDARVVDGLVDFAERGRAADVLHVNAVAGQTELRMIEKVEKFRSELESVLLVNREILESRKIRIHKARARNRRAGCVSEPPAGGSTKQLVLNHSVRIWWLRL